MGKSETKKEKENRFYAEKTQQHYDNYFGIGRYIINIVNDVIIVNLAGFNDEK